MLTWYGMPFKLELTLPLYTMLTSVSNEELYYKTLDVMYNNMHRKFLGQKICSSILYIELQRKHHLKIEYFL